MKIYTSKHNIKGVDFIKNGDIPLAFIDTKDTVYKADVKLFDGFAKDEKIQIQPYQNLLSNRTILFDESFRPVQKISYRKIGNELFYEPQNAKEFTPETFTCTATIQKQIEYDSTDEYNIIVGTIEKNSQLELASQLISIFGNAYKRGECPPNIRINDGSVIRETFIAASEDNPDFIFVETSDGENFSNLDIKGMVNNHTNIWISSSEWNDEKDSPRPFSAKDEGQLNSFYIKSKRKRLSRHLFHEDERYDLLKDKEYIYSYPYEDVLLIERKDKGFVVITPDDFIKNCRENIKVIYDILAYIYFRSYKKSRSEFSWITDEPIDYSAYSCDTLKTYHKQISLDSMLLQNGYDIRDRYRLISIETTNSKVSFVGMTPEKSLLFRKNKKTDPDKNIGIMSFLTSKNTVVLYEQQKIYLLTSRADIKGHVSGGRNYIVIAPLRDSNRSIFSDEEQELEVPDVKFIYYVCTRRGNSFSKNEFKLVEQSSYSMIEHGYRIAEVRFLPNYDTKVIDIRTPGGGLPSKEKDDYNLIDIGNLYGRPYRIGSTLIIRLPKKMEQYKDKIRKAVNQHIVAGEYPILIFEQGG